VISDWLRVAEIAQDSVAFEETEVTIGDGGDFSERGDFFEVCVILVAFVEVQRFGFVGDFVGGEEEGDALGDCGDGGGVEEDFGRGGLHVGD